MEDNGKRDAESPKGSKGFDFIPVPNQGKDTDKRNQGDEEAPGPYIRQPESKVVTAVKSFIRYRRNIKELEFRRAPKKTRDILLADARERLTAGEAEPVPEQAEAREMGDVTADIIRTGPGTYSKMIDFDGVKIYAEDKNITNEEERAAELARLNPGEEKYYFDERLLDFILRKIHEQWLRNNGTYISPVKFDLRELAYCFGIPERDARRDFLASMKFLQTIKIGGEVREPGDTEPHKLIKGDGKTDRLAIGGMGGKQIEEFIQSRRQREAELLLDPEGGALIAINSGTITDGVCEIAYDTNLEWKYIDRYTMPVPSYVYRLKKRDYDAALYVFQYIRQNARKKVFSKTHTLRISFRTLHETMNLTAESSPELIQGRKWNEKVKSYVTGFIERMGAEADKDGEISLRYEFDKGAKESSTGSRWLDNGYLVVEVHEGKYLTQLESSKEPALLTEGKASRRRPNPPKGAGT